ncbi:sensor histidine kinase [Undibacterium sp. Di27W]|uniref:sensor histidine kinase n=1 Tax=Undibacterium sp. Di27W TaxID=3413036 RepID=UPI003BF3FA2E
MQFHFDTLPLADLIGSTLQSNEGYAQSFDIEICYESPVDEAVLVRVDAQRFVQVLSNLLSNAIKFSRPHGQVDVRVSIIDEQVRVEVQDYGIGISEEFKSSIFQKFTQEDAKAARKYAGTGLGLSLSKTMMEKMGGQIGFISTENLGSCFYITLPIAATLSPSLTAA